MTENFNIHKKDWAAYGELSGEKGKRLQDTDQCWEEMHRGNLFTTDGTIGKQTKKRANKMQEASDGSDYD